MRCQKGKHLSLSASLLKCPQARRHGRHTSSKFTSCYNSLNVFVFFKIWNMFQRGLPSDLLINCVILLTCSRSQVVKYGTMVRAPSSCEALLTRLVSLLHVHGFMVKSAIINMETSSLLLLYYSGFWSVNVVKRQRLCLGTKTTW